MHKALERNLWAFGPEFSLFSTNITLKRQIEEYLQNKYVGNKADQRPDPLLNQNLSGEYLLIELYHWGDVENGLHNRYVTQDHAQADIYLLETIRPAEQQKLRVPPGAYADYGFLLFKRGDREGAIASFEKEKLLFPESSAFMTKLIERVKQKDAESTKKALPQAAVTPEAQP